MATIVKLISVECLSGYKILVKFNDGTQQLVDFEPFLTSNPHPQHNDFKQYERFKEFRIEKGTLVWGEDWDMIFPVEQLHAGQIEI